MSTIFPNSKGDNIPAGDRDEFRANIGITEAGDALVTAADAAAQRDLLLTFPGYGSATLTKGTSGTPGNAGELNELVLRNDNSGANVLSLENNAAMNPLPAMTFRINSKEYGAIGHLGLPSTNPNAPFTFLEISDIDSAPGTAPAFHLIHTTNNDGETGFGGWFRVSIQTDGLMTLNDRVGVPVITLGTDGVLNLNPSTIIKLSRRVWSSAGMGISVGSAATPGLNFAGGSGEVGDSGLYSNSGADVNVSSGGTHVASFTAANFSVTGTITASALLSCKTTGSNNAGLQLMAQVLGSLRQWNINHNSIDASLDFTVYNGSGYLTPLKILESGKIVADNTFRLKSYTVATLPASPVEGDTAYVTDATAPTYLGTAVGGGAVKAPVFYNGSAWVTH